MNIRQFLCSLGYIYKQTMVEYIASNGDPTQRKGIEQYKGWIIDIFDPLQLIIGFYLCHPQHGVFIFDTDSNDNFSWFDSRQHFDFAKQTIDQLDAKE